jgi:hypothetical protein
MLARFGHCVRGSELVVWCGGNRELQFTLDFGGGWRRSDDSAVQILAGGVWQLI